MRLAVPMLLAFGPIALISAKSTESTESSESSASITNATTIVYTITGTVAESLTALPTGSGITYPGDNTIILISTSSTSLTNSSIATLPATNATQTTSTTTSTSVGTSTLVGTATRANATATVVSGVECNGYTEFCNRKYSNVTYVVAHNSPFHIAGNAASNQQYDVGTQLDDGVRGLQSETHYVNDTVMLCHNSCSELNAGPLEDYLLKVKAWLDKNRYEVVTILLGNEAIIDPGNYTGPVTNSGLLDYVYTPPSEPMDIDGWPTLGEMILSNKRVVFMLAYEANQTAIPWLLNMWSYQWQTEFSPTNASFPCTLERPPGQARDVSEKRLYLVNHNLDVELDETALGGFTLLIPDIVELNTTNANVSVYGSAARTVDKCTENWGRPPNYLLVDYYNIGNFNGSTLAVAAEANNVTYDVNSCCGTDSVSDNAAAVMGVGWWTLAVATVAIVMSLV